MKAADAEAQNLPPLQLKLSPILTPPAQRATPLGPLSRITAPQPTLPRPPFAPGVTGPNDRGALFFRADSLSGTAAQSIEGEGQAELRTRTETVLADWLRYDFEADEIWGKDRVLIRRGLDTIAGPEMRLKREAQTGFFSTPQYFLGEAGGRGEAKELIFAGPDHYEMQDARYTTCVAGNDDWFVRALDFDVDNARKVGTATNATVVFKGVPIFYSPWLEFPLSNARKSGLLSPTFGSTGTRGLEFSIPYYWNIAPNYDATITPRAMSKRGVQLNTEFRYLFPDIAGQVHAEYLPNDRVAGTDRYGLAWQHNQTLLPGVAAYVNLNKVSDDTYFADLSDRLAITSQTTLLREAGLGISRGPFNLLARAQGFQTLQDPNAPIIPPYNRLPQLLFNMNEVDALGLGFAAEGEYVRFRQPQLLTGDRYLVYPNALWSRRGDAWFVTAKAGLHATHYDFDDTTLPRPRLNRTLPIVSADSGLIFERDSRIFGRAFLQTLEPRAYYVYIPYRNQSQIPPFDTALDDFNFSQLFTENRYIGNDRIGDANQLTLAVVTRLLDPDTADERLRLAVGQRYYFEPQRVTLTEPLRSDNSSPVLFTASGRLSPAWSADAGLEYDFNRLTTERLNGSLRYQPAPGRVINLSYRYIREQVDPTGIFSQLKQFDISAQWPIYGNWNVVGRYNYSLVDGKVLEAVAGIEYNGGCWVVRVVGQKLTTTTQQTTNSIFVQLELNGLARVGTNPLEVLRRGVGGYTPVNEPGLAPRRNGYFDALPDF